jgi:peroxiredoxin
VELPRLQPLHEMYKDKGLSIIAIEARRDTEGAQKFIEENKLTYHMVENGEDSEEIVRAIFGVDLFPTSFLLDREGKVRKCHIGFDEGDEAVFEQEIQELLGLTS